MLGNKFKIVTNNVARAFSDNNVKVVFAGTTAQTNGSIIQLPYFPSDANVTYDQAAVIQGYRDHEMLHIKASSFMTQEEADQFCTGDEFEAINALEDCRIESIGRRLSVGIKQNLVALNTSVSEKQLQMLNGMSPTDMYDEYSVALGTAIFRSWQRDGVEFPSFQTFWDSQSPEMQQLIDRTLDELEALPTGVHQCDLDSDIAKESSTKTRDLGKKFGQDIKALLEKEADEKQKQEEEEDEPNAPSDDPDDPKYQPGDEPKPQEDDEEDQEQEEGKGQGVPGGEEESQEEDGEPKGNKGGRKNGDDEDGEGEGGGGTDSSHGTSKPKLDLHKTAEENLEETAQQLNEQSDTGGIPQGDRFIDNFFILKPIGSEQVYKKKKSEKILFGTPTDALSVKRELEIALQARSDRNIERGQNRGWLDPKAFVRAVNGKTDVYRARSEGKELDTLVTIFVDDSGSMRDRMLFTGNGKMRIEGAVNACYLLVKACESVGCKTEIFFADSSMTNSTWWMVGERMNFNEVYGEITDLPTNKGCGRSGLLFCAKNKRQRVDSDEVKWGLRFMSLSFGGGTENEWWAEAMLYRMKDCPEKKKILLVLTDGDGRVDMVRKVLIPLSKRFGIIIVGIGIGYVSRVYPGQVNVHGEGLSKEVLKRIAKLIKED